MIENYDEIIKQLHEDIDRYIELDKKYEEFWDSVCKKTPCRNCPYNDRYSCYANDLVNAMSR